MKRALKSAGAPPHTPLLFGAVVAAYAGVLAAKWANTPVPTPEDAWPLLLFLAGALGLILGFRLLRLTPEPRLLLPALFLYGVGVAVQFRFDMYAQDLSGAASRHAGSVGMGLCLLAALIAGHASGRRLLPALAPLWYVLTLALLGAMIVLGQRFRGGVFLPGGINPTELIKVLLVLTWAPLLHAWRRDYGRTVAGWPAPPWRAALALLALWLPPMLALVYLRDFGLLVLCSAVLGVMLHGATGRTGYLVGGLVLAVGVLAVGGLVTPHIAARLTAWRAPFDHATGSGWQTLQALSAMYTGGAWGIGLGAGSPRLIPVASTDFVYAVIGEELGYFGCLLVIAAFLYLFRGAFETAGRQAEGPGRLIALGLAAMLALQTLLNLGGVTKSIPLTGVPLPFVSRGGSSLITSFLALGLLIGLAQAGKAPSRRRPGKRGKASS